MWFVDVVVDVDMDVEVEVEVEVDVDVRSIGAWWKRRRTTTGRSVRKVRRGLDLDQMARGMANGTMDDSVVLVQLIDRRSGGSASACPVRAVSLQAP
jgi:hypothetical protein